MTDSAAILSFLCVGASAETISCRTLALDQRALGNKFNCKLATHHLLLAIPSESDVAGNGAGLPDAQMMLAN